MFDNLTADKRYLVNGPDEQQLSEAIRCLLQKAEKYIKISSFLMQDVKIAEMLKKLSSSGKVAIFMLSNKKDQESEEYIESQEEKTAKKKVGFDNQYNILKELYYSGIHVRLLDDLHAKFVIVDGRESVIMSANLATNSLQRNIESGIELNLQDTQELEKVFDVMYKHADIVKYKDFGAKDIIIQQQNKLKEELLIGINGNIRLTVGSNNNTNLSSCKIDSIYREIVKIINESTEYVYILSWHFKLKGHKLTELIEAIRNAIDRGVDITLYSNTKTPVSSLEGSLTAIAHLKQIGCISFGDDKNHSKCVISEKCGILFTANIDDQNGMKTGFEVGCILSENQRKSAYQHIIKLLSKTYHGRK